MRAKAKRKQTIRRIEIIAIVAVVAVSLGVGFYLALNINDPRAVVDGHLLSQSALAGLVQASNSSYGIPGTTYWQTLVAKGAMATLSGTPFTTGGKPILVYVGADFCPFCAVQRWSLVMALMRFGSFTNLHYMTSAYDDGDYSTLTFYNSTYTSSYVVFQPFETETRSESPLMTLPANYSRAFDDQGGSSFPFLNFNNQYFISGAILDPDVLGTLNQTQIIASMNSAGNALGSEIRQAANVITALICKTSGENPSRVCDNPSITAFTTLILSYTLPPANQGSDLLLQGFVPASTPLEAYIVGLGHSNWD